MTKFAIFGDSYVTWLERFTNGHLPMSGTYRFFGESGMATARKFDEKFRNMLDYQPDVTFLIIGGNNIRCDSNVNAIVESLKAIVRRLQMAGVKQVYVAIIAERGYFPAFTGLTKQKFDKIKRNANRKLRKSLGPDLIDVVDKIKFPKHYHHDFVHPEYRQGGLHLLQKIRESCLRKYAHI